jgi:hypothetical protein
LDDDGAAIGNLVSVGLVDLREDLHMTAFKSRTGNT